jgi:hypothetical protein
VCVASPLQDQYAKFDVSDLDLNDSTSFSTDLKLNPSKFGVHFGAKASSADASTSASSASSRKPPKVVNVRVAVQKAQTQTLASFIDLERKASESRNLMADAFVLLTKDGHVFPPIAELGPVPEEPASVVHLVMHGTLGSIATIPNITELTFSYCFQHRAYQPFSAAAAAHNNNHRKHSRLTIHSAKAI